MCNNSTNGPIYDCNGKLNSKAIIIFIMVGFFTLISIIMMLCFGCSKPKFTSKELERKLEEFELNSTDSDEMLLYQEPDQSNIMVLNKYFPSDEILDSDIDEN